MREMLNVNNRQRRNTMSNDADDLRMLANQINYETAVSNGMDRWRNETPSYTGKSVTVSAEPPTVKASAPKTTKTGTWSPSNEELMSQLRIAKEEFIGAQSVQDHGAMNYWEKEILRIEREMYDNS